MDFHPLEYVKAHPYTAAAIGGVVVIGVVMLTAGGSSSQTQSSASDDSSLYDAEIQAANQQDQLTAQTQAQAAQINGELSLDQQNNSAQIALATLQVQQSNTQSGLAYELGLAQVQAGTTAAQLQAGVQTDSINTAGTVQEDQYSTQEAINQAIQNTSVSTTQLNDAAQTGIAALVGQTQQIISTNQSQVAIQQANDQAATTEAVAGDVESAAKTSSITSGIGGIASGLIGALF